MQTPTSDKTNRNVYIICNFPAELFHMDNGDEFRTIHIGRGDSAGQFTVHKVRSTSVFNRVISGCEG